MKYIVLTGTDGKQLVAAPGMIQLVTSPTEGAPDTAKAEITVAGGGIWYVTDEIAAIVAQLNPEEE